MNFDEALKRHLPRIWFRFKFLKYKYLKRGEAELRLIRHLIEPGATAIDAGASIGIYAAEMARYAGRVLAFEANPEVAAFARRVAAGNVEVINVALSSATGRTTLTVPVNAKGRAVTELASIVPKESGTGIAIGVETRRLDDFAVANCSFIKIDVEGHEEAVLDGASALIAAQRPVLMIELVEAFNPGVVARLTERYAAMSYTVFFSKHGLKPIAEFDAARDQDEALMPSREYVANFFFIPQEKCERLLARL
ncbi:MAG: FkbM family methyltransferase [Alphaproteobacteria bacterium]|nr:MAG: FkbM family methyltransferase [Alphaproteobacteria bacterium]